MRVLPLTEQHEAVLLRLLREDPIQNLFLLGILAKQPPQRELWYGAFEKEEVLGVILVIHDRLAVPYAPCREAADALGDFLRNHPLPQMLVGPREACDSLWTPWSRGRPAERMYDQVLFVCSTTPQGDPLAGLRRATLADSEIIGDFSGKMEAEDLGRNPALENPSLHRQVVRDRIRNGKTWVVEEGHELVFMINVGTSTDFGCQVGGTYVPPHHRGRRIATRAMIALNQKLLQTHRVVTLHVNGANHPAVTTYQRSGFEFCAPFRLITVAKT